MGTIATVLVTLLSVALSYGLSEAGTYIENAVNRQNGVTYKDITNAVDKIISEARAAGTTIYNRVTNKLNDVQAVVGSSNGYVRDIYRKALNRYSSELSNVEEKLKTLDSKGAILQQKAQQLANETNAYKVAYGKQDLEELKKETQQIKDELTKDQNSQDSLKYNGGNLEESYEKKI